MKKEQVVRNFKLADSVLKQKADEFIALIDRDVAEFTDRGYSPAKKAELMAARSTVDSFPSDEQLEAIKINLTEQKDATRKALEKSMRSIFNMAENVFGQFSAKYKEFGNALISQQRCRDCPCRQNHERHRRKVPYRTFGRRSYFR